MDIQFLGTGAGQPSKARNVSSLALKLLDEINEVWLFDCGEATQNQILETTIRPRKVSKIFITHLHGDHIFGLPGFLSSRAFQANEEQTDLDIYGPVGIKSFVMTSLRVSGSRLPYRIHFHEFDEHSLGKILETDKFTVYAEALDHTIFCVGYRIMQKDLEGTLDADKLKAAGVPFGPLFGKVKNGQDVTLEDGTKIIAADYISAPRPGKIITILGDTRKTDASVRLGVNADVLVHESTYGKGDEKIAKKHGHSTNMQAAEVAREAGAKRLLLNHISARFLSKDISQLRKDASSIFENVYVVKDRLILLGRNQEKLEKLYASHPQAECIGIDITDSSDVQDLVEELYQRYGQIDILVNNAGYGIFEAFDRISDQQVQEMFEVNTFALMQLSRLMGAHMKEAGKGHIVNIVSMAGLVATAKSSLYSATKFAAIGFSNALRLELMPFGVHVTTVNPGPIRTTFFDQADPDGSYVKAVDRYILEPDFVAKKIVKNFGKAKRELNLPWLLNLTHKLYTLFPRISDKLASKMFNFK